MRRNHVPSTSWRAVLFLSLSFVCAGTVRGDWNWSGWRGLSQNGHSAETGLPVEWDDGSVTWKTPLKGEGQSSPVIWGEWIFLTSAVDKGAQRVVMCLDRNDGQILWEKVAWTGTPERSHGLNGWASATCVTDGEHVYAFFGKGRIHCYTLKGNHVWSKDLGPFVSPWGTAACPVLVGNLIIQNCDADADAYIVGLDKKTGKQIWKTKRDDARGWSSPILVNAAGRDEVVVNGDKGVRAYNPKTGKELWFCKGFNGRGSPTVTLSEAGLVHVINGLRGDIYAIKPGGNGDVTGTHMAWHTPRGGGRDLPSPIAVGNYLFGLTKSGILTCYDTQSGKELWKARLEESSSYTSSPIAYQGIAFFTDVKGHTTAVKPGKQFNAVARNELSGVRELFRASPTPSDGQIFLRSNKTLYCIGKRKAAAK